MCAAVAVTRRRCYPFSDDHIHKHQSKMLYQKYRVKDIDAHFDSIRASCIRKMTEAANVSAPAAAPSKSQSAMKKASTFFHSTLFSGLIFDATPTVTRSNSEPAMDGKTGRYKRPSIIDIPVDYTDQEQIVCYSLNDTPVGHLSDSE
jgi:hypothetical protein